MYKPLEVEKNGKRNRRNLYACFLYACAQSMATVESEQYWQQHKFLWQVRTLICVLTWLLAFTCLDTPSIDRINHHFHIGMGRIRICALTRIKLKLGSLKLLDLTHWPSGNLDASQAFSCVVIKLFQQPPSCPRAEFILAELVCNLTFQSAGTQANLFSGLATFYTCMVIHHVLISPLNYMMWSAKIKAGEYTE